MPSGNKPLPEPMLTQIFVSPSGVTGPQWVKLEPGLQDTTMKFSNPHLLHDIPTGTWHWFQSDIIMFRLCSIMYQQTPLKLLGFYWTECRFGPDFADIKHCYTQKFYRSYSSFISQCPRSSKFRGVCIRAHHWVTCKHLLNANFKHTILLQWI